MGRAAAKKICPLAGLGRVGPEFGPNFCVQSPLFWAELSGLLQAKTGRAKKQTKKSFLACPKPAQKQKQKNDRAGPGQNDHLQLVRNNSVTFTNPVSFVGQPPVEQPTQRTAQKVLTRIFQSINIRFLDVIQLTLFNIRIQNYLIDGDLGNQITFSNS